MNKEILKSLIGKEVNLYPGDTHKKRAIIKEVDDTGVLFKITYYSGDNYQYEVGKLYFISHQSKLSLSGV